VLLITIDVKVRRQEAPLDMERPIQLSSIDVIASALEPASPILGQLSSPDGAVTLMLSDIADASTAAQELGPERWERLVRDHHLVVEQLVAGHDGTVVRFEQDGFLASFNSAHAGLRAAVEMQRAFAGTAAGMRVGLHSGFVIANPDQLLGRNVVLAARIAAIAQGGEILTSSTLKRYTETDPTFRFESRGEFHFKGLHGEHVVYSVDWH
jgi:class 3 adenylate cyclase